MPKPRKKENLGLPTRWIIEHGAYYYRVPPGAEPAWDGKKKFRLGKSLAEAHRAWGDRAGMVEYAGTIGALLDRYLLEVIPRKAVTTQSHNRTAIKPIMAVFGKMRLTELRPSYIYKYVDKRGGTTGAHREIEVLSHAFTKAVEWGYIDRHPFKGEVRLKGEKPSDRYVEDWEIVEALSIISKRKLGSVRSAQAYIRIKLLTGLRLGDMLRIKTAQMKEDGIHVTPGKTQNSTGKSIIYEWTTELRAAVNMALAARPRDSSEYLFCTLKGECYFKANGRPGGWPSLWNNFLDRVIEETDVTERFNEQDLRAKCASDAKTLEHAQQLLAHADSKITQRVYRRKAEIVKPLR